MLYQLLREPAAIARVARALADPTRLDIFRTIATRGECCCGDISRCLSVTPATVTHHLRILGEAGLVTSRRDGQFIRLQPDPEAIDTFCRSLASLTRPDRADGHAPSQQDGRPASTRRPAGRQRPRPRALNGRQP